jgi:arginine/lysine/ornithine decarboxylase
LLIYAIEEKIVLVDAAHGVHLLFNDQLFESAVKHTTRELIYAFNITHKILSAMCLKGQVLHFNSKLVDFNRVIKAAESGCAYINGNY